MTGTYVYIDGFNFYHGAVKGTAYKWLDLAAFCDRLLPNDTVTMVRYFTAPMSGGSGARQRIYLRVLKDQAQARVSVHEGHFELREKTGRQIAPPTQGKKLVTVEAREEKGTDVNLASYLLRDGFLGLYDTAVVISNDSDLCEPVRMVRQELHKRVGIVNPRHNKSPYQLDGDFRARIIEAHLANAQLPPSVQLSTGTSLTKPNTW